MKFLQGLLVVNSLDIEGQRRANLLNILLIGIGTLTFLALLATLFFVDRSLQGVDLLIVGTFITLIAVVIIFLIGHYWSYRLASWLISIFLVFIFAFSDSPEEVVDGRALFAFTIPILISSFLIGPKSSFVIATLSSILLTIISLNALNTISSYLVTGFFAIALVAWLAARSLEQVLAELRVANQELEKRSAELEVMNALLRQENVERRRAEMELAEQAQTLRRTNAELQQFAYVSTHDLREPLRKVRSYAELLEHRYRGQLDEKADKYIDYIVSGATRMQVLITDLLAYLSVGERELSYQITDLSEVLGKVLQDLALLVQENSAIITHDPLPIFKADPSQITHLLQNLVSNAIKFRREEPPNVHIGVKRENGEWLISVTDNGIGLEDQYAERIFVIFQRLHTKEVYPGTGIGLAICKKVVENHNGRIWLTSTVGQGTTFYFTLPV